MTSLRISMDAVKAAVVSTATCTPATVVALRDLLLVDPDPVETTLKPGSRAANSTTAKSKTVATSKKHPVRIEQLSAKERALLATYVINTAFKVLAEAAKPTPSSETCEPTENFGQSTAKRTLRRSLSTPLSPIQPRTLNRIATAPTVAKKSPRSSPLAQSTGCLAVVECARAAFACLRSTKSPQDSQYDYQVENGMSVFIGKLLNLGLHDHALREMRLLKQRLESTATSSSMENPTAAAGVATLLDFKEETSGLTLPLITSLQGQVLKLICATKRPAYIEAMLPFLRETNANGPIALLLKLAADGPKQTQKASRQLAIISQSLLAMLPSISSHEDAVATEPRLSPSPLVAFEVQSLAFRVQLRWWKLAGHHGSIDEDILSPFNRCVRALARRYGSDDKLLYHNIAGEYESLQQLIRAHGHLPSNAPKSPLASIYQILGSTAHAARRYEDACRWFESLRASLSQDPDAVVLVCSVSARILAAQLKKAELDTDVDSFIEKVTDSLEGSLSGTASELNELFDSMSAVRKSIAGVLMKDMDSKNVTKRLPQTTGQLLKKFTMQYPRFVRRWMGTPPGKDTTAKQQLQFDQRKHLVLQSINQTLDATLTVVKSEIQSNTFEWQQLDDALQHCIILLTLLAEPAASPARAEQLGSYYVKISTLYFSKFVDLRQVPDRSKVLNKQMLQSLSRSIDVVKDRCVADQNKAQLPMKLEFFADLCKNAGRSEDAVKTLRSICTNMAEEGVLSDVAASLATLPPSIAWSSSEKASSLSRTLRSIAKLDKSWNDWTFFLPEAERAAVLEHLMHLSSDSSSHGQILRLHDPSPVALLRIYTLEKYPVRRFRVLLHLLYQNIGEVEETAKISACLDQLLGQLQNKDRGEDNSLSHFIPHLQAYHSSMLALAAVDESFPSIKISDNIASWKLMLESLGAKDNLYTKIDDPDMMVGFLEALSNLAGLRGEAQLRTSVLELSIALFDAISKHRESPQDGLVWTCNVLAAQQVTLGKFAAAAGALNISRELIQKHKDLPPRVIASFHMSQAEYYVGIGSLPDSSISISKAREICQVSHSRWAKSKAEASVMLSTLALIQSTISLQTGNTESALASIKNGVRNLSRDWAKAEALVTNSASSSSPNGEGANAAETSKAVIGGPQTWGLATPLLRCLLHISCVYAHIGMFQETIYYAESARRIAESAQSLLFRAQVASWMGSIYLKAGNPTKALEIMEAAKHLMPGDISSPRVQFAHKLGEVYSAKGDEENAEKYFNMAEETVMCLAGKAGLKEPPVASTSARTTVSRRTRATNQTTKARAVPRVIKSSSRHTPARANATDVLSPTKDIHQSSLLASVNLSRVLDHVQKKEWSQALSTLEQVKELPKLMATLSLEQAITATTLIGHSMNQMVSDPVYSVMQDSTISLPAIASNSDRMSIDKSSLAASPPKRARSVTSRSVKDKSAPGFAEALKQAQRVLVEAHGSSLLTSDSGMVHRLSTLLQNTIILLSAATAPRSRAAIQSTAFASVAVDLGRNVTWMREQDTLRSFTETSVEGSSEMSEPSVLAIKDCESMPMNMPAFNDAYINLLPKQWSVISLSLSGNRHDLSITKLQKGQSPFTLRLPLERANYRDADSEVFNFQHGRDELLDIISLANETSHSARDFSAKGERNAWWAEREALDARLKNLLSTVETTWLGGFKGIFSQHRNRPDLLSRFGESFQQMLDTSLPSRNRTRGKKTTKSPSVTLDPRILELFIALGNPIDPDCDYDEALNDLLYFVVDILQFHGERNAYDEIDFDAMMVETYDALRGYYSGVKSGPDREDGAHTILVLDKALLAFPWESLPCMQGLAVSRVPSLAYLRQLITQSNPPDKAGRVAEGHQVSRHGGTYMLNPSSDLKNTQEFFQSSFERLENWTGIVNKAPRECDFEEALTRSEILLYFGHGGGAQYIRGKTVRRLEKCKPATFLMGCSSASLNEAGEFECYGPVWNYMLAGCPAVVGTLWDVTDRDIDRFAGRAFEEWGLFPRGTFAEQDRKGSKARGKSRSSSRSPPLGCSGTTTTTESGSMCGSMSTLPGPKPSAPHAVSLPEAVARARDACKFRYLNAAAVVVYGIPVYIRQD